VGSGNNPFAPGTTPTAAPTPYPSGTSTTGDIFKLLGLFTGARRGAPLGSLLGGIGGMFDESAKNAAMDATYKGLVNHLNATGKLNAEQTAQFLGVTDPEIQRFHFQSSLQPLMVPKEKTPSPFQVVPGQPPMTQMVEGKSRAGQLLLNPTTGTTKFVTDPEGVIRAPKPSTAKRSIYDDIVKAKAQTMFGKPLAELTPVEDAQVTDAAQVEYQSQMLQRMKALGLYGATTATSERIGATSAARQKLPAVDELAQRKLTAYDPTTGFSVSSREIGDETTYSEAKKKYALLNTAESEQMNTLNTLGEEVTMLRTFAPAVLAAKGASRAGTATKMLLNLPSLGAKIVTGNEATKGFYRSWNQVTQKLAKANQGARPSDYDQRINESATFTSPYTETLDSVNFKLAILDAQTQRRRAALMGNPTLYKQASERLEALAKKAGVVLPARPSMAAAASLSEAAKAANPETVPPPVISPTAPTGPITTYE